MKITKGINHPLELICKWVFGLWLNEKQSLLIENPGWFIAWHQSATCTKKIYTFESAKSRTRDEFPAARGDNMIKLYHHDTPLLAAGDSFKKTMINKRAQAFIPLVFWLVIIAIKLIGVLPMYEGEVLSSRLETIVITTSLEILTFLYFYYLIIPNLLRKNRLVLNVGLALFFWCSFGIVWSLVYRYAGRTETFEESIIIYKASLGHTLLSTLYAVVLRLSVDWINKYQRQQELEKQNVKTELALLRSQVNPHFLFNTLNNIHSFSTRDPEKTSFAIIKLSEIMRYMLYDATGEKVLLDNEISYINNFIALQKLRYKERDFVKFTIEGDTSNLFIPPMIFLPFIENAFKHGKLSVENAIDIQIKIQGKKLRFRCVNQIKELNETEKGQPGGIGMKNIQRRLELLFPAAHQLSIKMEKNHYFVELNLQLDAY